MVTSYRHLEPFPLFIDSAPPSAANYFSSNIYSSLHVLSSSRSPSRDPDLRKPRISLPTKLSNSLRLRYYQYEVTFGLYMLTPREKLILNAIILTIFTALSCALYWGLRPFFIRTVCQWIYYLTGSLENVKDVCT